MYLFDTMVLSEMRKPSPNRNLAKWLTSIDPSDIRISVISIMEIGRGADRKRARDPEFALRLDAWLESLVARFADSILPVTVDIARGWGRLEAQLQRQNIDFAIAATALEHNLQIVTRNRRDFEQTGVVIINPFEPA